MTERTWRDAVYGDIFEHIECGLGVWESDGASLRLLCANRCAAVLLGLKADEGPLDRVLDDAHLAARIREGCEHVQSRHGRWECPALEVGEAGDKRVLALRAFPIPGTRTGIEVRDVTTQHELQRKLRRRDHQLTEAQAVTQLGSWDWNVADDTVTWSDELYRIFGLDPAEFEATYEAYLERIHPDDRAQIHRTIAHTVETGEPFHQIKRIVRPDGSIRYLDSRVHVNMDPVTGKAAMLYGTSLDITDRLRREHKLVESEERYRRLFEEALTGNFIATGIGQYLGVNKSFVRMFGFESETKAMEGRLVDLFPGEQAFREFLGRLREQGSLSTVELELRHTDGRPLRVMGNFIASKSDDGAVVEVKGYMLDVSEHRKVEQQLLHMQKMDAIGRLAGGVAHDFNNLLTIILSYVHVLRRRQGEDATAHGALDAIAEAAESASQLTRQLLTVGRGQLIERKVVDANEIVSDAKGLLGRVIGEDIQLEVECHAGKAYVDVGGGQLEQVLLNLALNARDAMPNGGRLRLETDIVPSNGVGFPGLPRGEYVTITVTDTGTGMTPDVQSHVFEPFYTTKPPGKGSGLGLSTVYGIVKQAGGDVSITSAVGQGTTIRIVLPLARPKDSAAAESITPRTASPGTERVLAVEDAGPLRELIRQVLEEAGYEAQTAGTAEAALELVEKGYAPDVLLTDVILPGSNGPALVRRLRDRWPRLRAIYMSGYSRAVSFGKQDVPAGHYLSKPFTPDQLLALIRDVLDASAPAAPPPK